MKHMMYYYVHISSHGNPVHLIPKFWVQYSSSYWLIMQRTHKPGLTDSSNYFLKGHLMIDANNHSNDCYGDSQDARWFDFSNMMYYVYISFHGKQASYSNGPISIIILPLTGNLKDTECLFNWFTLVILWKILVRIYKLS